jgi:hypothetical protein
VRLYSVSRSSRLRGCASSNEDDESLDRSGALQAGATLADSQHLDTGFLRFFDGPGVVNYCTAALIGRRTVITAGHCITPVPAQGSEPAKLCSGDFGIDLTGKGGPALRTYLPYTQCAVLNTSVPSKNDLAILHLERDAPLEVQPLVLASASPTIGQREVFGYGLYGSGCRNPIDFHKRKVIRPAAAGVFQWQYTCGGDSGGPHIMKDGNELIGITSGRFIGQVVADTVANRAWIQRRLAESEASTKFTEAVNIR